MKDRDERLQESWNLKEEKRNSVMATDYLENAIAQCKKKWDNECLRQCREVINDYQSAAKVQNSIDRDIDAYCRHYNNQMIVKEILKSCVCGFVMFVVFDATFKAGGLLGFIVGAGAYIILRRHPAVDQNGKPDWENIRSSPNLRHILNPNLIDIIGVRSKRTKTQAMQKQQLDEKKQNCEARMKQIKADCEQAKNREIAKIRAQYGRRY